MTKKIMIGLLCGFFFLIGCGLMFLNSIGIFRDIKIEQYQKYLENTYGEEKGFTLVEEGYENYFEVGYGEHYFTADNLDGKTFTVYGGFNENNRIRFADDYVRMMYDEQLKEKYAAYFKDFLRKDMYISSIHFDVREHIPLVSYDEYLELLKDIEIGISLSAPLKEVEDIYDIEDMEVEMAEIIQKNNLDNIEDVTLFGEDDEAAEYSAYELYKKLK